MEENKLVKYDSKELVKVGNIINTTEKLLAQANNKSLLQPRKPMILIVDDEKSIRDALNKILISEDYNTMLAEDGKVAYYLLKENDGKIDVMLTNIKMPKLDGIELIEKLPSFINYALAVVVITGMYDATYHPDMFFNKLKNNEKVIRVNIIKKPPILSELLNSIKEGVEQVKIRRIELNQF